MLKRATGLGDVRLNDTMTWQQYRSAASLRQSTMSMIALYVFSRVHF